MIYYGLSQSPFKVDFTCQGKFIWESSACTVIEPDVGDGRSLSLVWDACPGFCDIVLKRIHVSISEIRIHEMKLI